MSTRIDINVAGDLLRRLNRSQQQANRQGLLERERRERLAQQGIEEIRRQREAEKRRRNGEPIYGQRRGRRRVEEPAALLPTDSQQGLETVAFVQHKTEYLETSIRITIRNASNTASAQFTISLPELPPAPLWPDVPVLPDSQVIYYDADGNIVGLDDQWDTFIRRVQRSGQWPADLDLSHMVLPVRGSTVMYVYSLRYNRSGYYVKYTQTGNRNGSTESIDKGTYSVSETTAFKCFLINNASMRELAVPEALRGALGSLQSAYDLTGVQPTPVDMFPFTGDVYVDKPYVLGGIREALQDIPLLYSYGLSRANGLYANYNSGSGTGLFTPGVYTFINAFRGSPPADSNNYATIRNYLSDAPVPSMLLAPCILEGSCPTGWSPGDPDFVTFDSTTNLPTLSDQPLDTTNFKRATRRLDLVDIDYYSAHTMFAWDWGRSSYCRAQLQALGFTDEDLTS